MAGKRKQDLTGQRSGRLLLTEYAGVIKGRHYYFALCDCGQDALIRADNFKSGGVKSCGCLVKESAVALGKSKLKHGAMRKRTDGSSRGTPEYQAWKNMKKEEHISEFDDFQNFFTHLGWRPTGKHYLARHDIREQHSTTNTYWKHPDENNERQQLTLDTSLGFDIRGVVDTATAQTVGAGEDTQGSSDWQEASGRCEPDAVKAGSTNKSRERTNTLSCSSSLTLAGVTQ